MERKRQREVALAVVAVLLIATAVLRIRSAVSGSPATNTSPTAVSAPATRQSPTTAPAEVTEIDLQALKGDRPEPMDATRNPFRFKPRPAPPPPAAPPVVRPSAPVNTGPAEPPPPPRIPLKFIGIIDSPATGRFAVLSDARGVYQGRVGETIEGRYRILNIGVESVDLAYVDGRGRQTIRLTGQ
jgi:hypothetical protein